MNQSYITTNVCWRFLLLLSIQVIICQQEQVSQLNCSTQSAGICNHVCNEETKLHFSATFCDHNNGTCFCDCRDKIKESCVKTPFTPCYEGCVQRNPNPDVYLYVGGNCPLSSGAGNQCACECSIRDDYIETNEVF